MSKSRANCRSRAECP